MAFLKRKTEAATPESHGVLRWHRQENNKEERIEHNLFEGSKPVLEVFPYSFSDRPDDESYVFALVRNNQYHRVMRLTLGHQGSTSVSFYHAEPGKNQIREMEQPSDAHDLKRDVINLILRSEKDHPDYPHLPHILRLAAYLLVRANPSTTVENSNTQLKIK